MNILDLKYTGMLNEDGSINYDSNKLQPLHVSKVSLGGNQYYLTADESELNSWYINTSGQSSSGFYRNIYRDIPKTYEMECKCCGHKVICNSEEYRLEYVCDDCKNSKSPVRGIISKYLRSLSLMN